MLLTSKNAEGRAESNIKQRKKKKKRKKSSVRTVTVSGEGRKCELGKKKKERNQIKTVREK